LSPQLAVNDGPTIEQVRLSHLAYFPKGEWREPNTDELALLVSADPERIHTTLEERLFLFVIPESIWTLFWSLDFQKLVEQPTLDCYDFGSQYRQVAAETLVEISDLLNELGHSLSGDSICETLFNLPDLRSLRFDRDLGTNAGLGLDEVFGTSDGPESHKVVAGVNFGDEPRYLYYINLSTSHLMEMLPSTVDNEGLSGNELARAFMTEFPSYPVSRVTLEPRSGYLALEGSFIQDESMSSMSGPGIKLSIRATINRK
jgi:hypothetical protein